MTANTTAPDLTGPSETISDAALLELSRRSPERFGEIYDRYVGEIHAYLGRRLDRQAADDLTAEVFLAAFRKRETFDPERGSVRPWLYGFATNLIASHRRNEIRRLAALQRNAAAYDGADDGHEERVVVRVDAVSAQGRLAAELRALSDGDRDVLLLSALGELSHEEVARALDIPYGTVGSRLSRARRKLRAALGGVNPLSGGSDG
ncbi:DNA-directed RNA polymerase sigma-70 factor [Planomonospora sphaerica]|uniref:DNA-directed RNA polymerase sigma-70 factor n=1 Tax=Planomonospora sphaerica TaxID=161355 RepID=A0A161MAI2_9ACTN|nr:RNA polymerase sigma factor [Planomonospora sphaerica]GAT66693.1 DNA-directed RNA polymerase sigma-70 factor [Planomonospora sphaerica]